MSTGTIEAIEEAVRLIYEELKLVRILPQYAEQRHGREQEYVAGNLEKESRSILTRLSTVLDLEEGFLNISDYIGREKVKQKLHELLASLRQLNSRGAVNAINEIGTIFQHIDELKPFILSFEKALPAEQLKKINTMLENERKILNQTAGKAVAGAFNKRLEYVSSSKFWIVPFSGAFIFLVAALVALYCLFIHNMELEEISLAQSLPRLAFTSILVSPGVFCLRQYIRHRNILDDYNYKVDIAESIDPTLGILNNARDQERYLKIAFEAIHQHPLARNHEPHTSVKGLISRLQPLAPTNTE